MRKIRSTIIFALLALLFTASSAVFAGGQQEASSSEESAAAPAAEDDSMLKGDPPSAITIIDAAGREVTISKPVKRIAFSNSTTGEMIKLVGAWDRVVVVDFETHTQPLLYPGASELPVINSMSSPFVSNIEELFEIAPDILLTVKAPIPGFEEMAARLEPEIPVVVVVNPNDTNAWTRGAELLGKVLGQEKEAAEFIDWYEKAENSIKERTAGLSEQERTQVFFKTLGMSPEQLCTYTDEFGFVKHLFEASGGINIGADLPSTGGWVQDIDQEWLLEQNPEVVMAATWEGYHPGALGFEVDDPSSAAAVRDSMMGMTVFEGADAVTNGKFYIFDTHFTATPRFLILMAYWGKWLHPELFTDLDPKALHQEYLTRFMRVDYNLDEHGVFFYPEPQ